MLSRALGTRFSVSTMSSKAVFSAFVRAAFILLEISRMLGFVAEG
jgi:hypothetical protein